MIKRITLVNSKNAGGGKMIISSPHRYDAMMHAIMAIRTSQGCWYVVIIKEETKTLMRWLDVGRRDGLD